MVQVNFSNKENGDYLTANDVNELKSGININESIIRKDSFSGYFDESNNFRYNMHLEPKYDGRYDIGSPENKIRHIYLSNGSLWIGDEIKIDSFGNELVVKARDKTKLPYYITGILGGTADNATGFANVNDVSELSLFEIEKYAKSLNPDVSLSDIFPEVSNTSYKDEDYSSKKTLNKSISGTSEDLINYGISKYIDITELRDTPTGYESGYYLRSNETGIEYVDINVLSDNLIQNGFSAGGTNGLFTAVSRDIDYDSFSNFYNLNLSDSNNFLLSGIDNSLNVIKLNIEPKDQDDKVYEFQTFVTGVNEFSELINLSFKWDKQAINGKKYISDTFPRSKDSQDNSENLLIKSIVKISTEVGDVNHPSGVCMAEHHYIKNNYAVFDQYTSRSFTFEGYQDTWTITMDEAQSLDEDIDTTDANGNKFKAGDIDNPSLWSATKSGSIEVYTVYVYNNSGTPTIVIYDHSAMDPNDQFINLDLEIITNIATNDDGFVTSFQYSDTSTEKDKVHVTLKGSELLASVNTVGIELTSDFNNSFYWKLDGASLKFQAFYDDTGMGTTANQFTTTIKDSIGQTLSTDDIEITAENNNDDIFSSTSFTIPDSQLL